VFDFFRVKALKCDDFIRQYGQMIFAETRKSSLQYIQCIGAVRPVSNPLNMHNSQRKARQKWTMVTQNSAKTIRTGNYRCYRSTIQQFRPWSQQRHTKTYFCWYSDQIRTLLNRFFLNLLLSLFNRADVHKCLFGQMIPLPFANLTAAGHGAGGRDILPFQAGKIL